MTNMDDTEDLKRLQLALEAVSTDLDAIEGRPHLHLWHAAGALETTPARGIVAFVDQFAQAMARSSSKQAAS